MRSLASAPSAVATPATSAADAETARPRDARTEEHVTLRRALVAYIGGFLATLTLHQGALALMHALGWTDRVPFVLQPTPPFGLPQVISLALWGGLWGIIMIAVLPRALANTRYIVAGSVFGALLPSAAALLVVLPLKGQPMAGGGDVRIIIAALILNGLWGAGTALFIDLFGRATRDAVPDRVRTGARRI